MDKATFYGGDSESKERPVAAGGEHGNSLRCTTRMGDIQIWEVLPARLQHSASTKPWLFTFKCVEECCRGRFVNSCYVANQDPAARTPRVSPTTILLPMKIDLARYHKCTKWRTWCNLARPLPSSRSAISGLTISNGASITNCIP